MTPDLLAAAVGCTQALAVTYAAPLTAAMTEFGIDTPRRQAMFLAQVGHESGGLARVVENLNYSAEGLMRTWPLRFRTMEAAESFARNPERIANYVYASRLGNGDASTGDGWRFRGRGLIQVTGRSNYAAAGQALGLDLIAAPDLLMMPIPAARSAGWFWAVRDLNGPADAGDLAETTRRINGGLNGLDDRRARYVRACQAMGV